MAYVADAVTLWPCLQQCVYTGGFELRSSALTSSTLKWLDWIQCGFNRGSSYIFGHAAQWKSELTKVAVEGYCVWLEDALSICRPLWWLGFSRTSHFSTRWCHVAVSGDVTSTAFSSVMTSRKLRTQAWWRHKTLTLGYAQTNWRRNHGGSVHTVIQHSFKIPLFCVMKMT
jgi:hypothetical protein